MGQRPHCSVGLDPAVLDADSRGHEASGAGSVQPPYVGKKLPTGKLRDGMFHGKRFEGASRRLRGAVVPGPAG